jgi:hypothetical protein
MAVCVTQTLRLDTTHEHSNYKLVIASAGIHDKNEGLFVHLNFPYGYTQETLIAELQNASRQAQWEH